MGRYGLILVLFLSASVIPLGMMEAAGNDYPRVSVQTSKTMSCSEINEMLKDNPYFMKAMEYARVTDLSKLPLGKHVLDSTNLWLTIMEVSLKTREEARLEAHDEYIDIQIPLSCDEVFGVKDRSKCASPSGPFDKEADIIFFEDVPDRYVTVKAFEPIVFTPELSHAPLIGEGLLRKAVFKVKVLRDK